MLFLDALYTNKSKRRTDLNPFTVSREALTELSIGSTNEGDPGQTSGRVVIGRSARASQLGLGRANIYCLGSTDGCDTMVDAAEGTLEATRAGGDVRDAQWVAWRGQY